MALLTGCCCCFDNLRDGARAVGITLLVLGTLSLIYMIAHTAMLKQEEHARLAGGEVALIVFQFLVCILHLIFNALLVYGVNESRRGMVLAWIIYHGIITGLQSIGVAIGFIITCVYGIWWVVLLMLALAALVGVFWYWFVVVLHYYQDMQEKNGFVYGQQKNNAL